MKRLGMMNSVVRSTVVVLGGFLVLSCGVFGGGKRISNQPRSLAPLLLSGESHFFGSRPAIDPEHEVVVFASNATHPAGEIFSIPLSGGEPTRLTSNMVYDGYPAISPDGDKICFVSDLGGDLDLYLMDIDGRNRRRLTDTPGRWETFPVFIDHGKRIAYIRYYIFMKPSPVDQFYSHSELVILDIDSPADAEPVTDYDFGTVEALRVQNETVLYVMHSPVYTVRYAGGGLSLLKVDLMAEDAERAINSIKSSLNSGEPMNFDPIRKRIYRARNTGVYKQSASTFIGQVAHTDFESADATTMTAFVEEGDIRVVSVSEDGEWIVFERKEGARRGRIGGHKSQIHAIRADGSDYRQLTHFQ